MHLIIGFIYPYVILLQGQFIIFNEFIVYLKGMLGHLHLFPPEVEWSIQCSVTVMIVYSESCWLPPEWLFDIFTGHIGLITDDPFRTEVYLNQLSLEFVKQHIVG